jgi:hypothetical protein
MNRLATIARTAAAAAVTCACVLACAWPTRTEADDFDGRQADIGANTTKAGKIQATSRLVEDTSVKGKWYIEIEAKNTSAETQTAEFDEQVLKESMAAAMARSGPIPTVAWKVHEKVQVLPNETALVRHPLPAWLSQQIAASRAAPKTNKDGEPIMVARVGFMTMIDQRVPPEAVEANPRVQVAQAASQGSRGNQMAMQQQARISPQSRGRNYSMP